MRLPKSLTLVAVSFFVGAVFVHVQAAPIVAAGNKCGVNVGPYYEQVDQVKSMTKEGGWIVLLGSLGQCADYNKVFGKGLNVVLRAYNGGQKFDNTQADAWVATLNQLDTKGQKVYFMPWNEPNHEEEGGGATAGREVKNYTDYLQEQLRNAGLLNTKVILLSPMVDKTNPSFVNGTFFQNISKEDFYAGFAGSSINEYDVSGVTDTGTYTPCSSGLKEHNNCEYPNIGISSPYFALESGVTYNNGPKYRDGHLKQMLDRSWQVWSSDEAFNMFAIFSYDPLAPGDWNIYQATQTKQFYASNCSASNDIPALETTNPTQYNNWFGNKEGTLVACPSGCGFAPKDRPELCQAAGRTDDGYDLSIYDDYNADPNKFYIHPIAGLVPNYDSRQIGTVRSDLIRQGYEAHCATPQFKIKLTQYGEKWMGSYIDAANGHPGGTVFGGDIVYDRSTDWDTEDIPYRSTLTVDYRSTLLPVFRDVTGKRWLTASLEEYFGFTDTKVGDASLSELNSAPANSLLNQTQRCIQSATLLFKQEEMCNKINPATNCALYPRPVPDSLGQYTIKTLLDEYKTAVGSEYKNTEKIAKFCSQLMRSNASSEKNLKDGMLKVPLTIDRAYRLGFLVTDIELLRPSLNRMFNLFTHPNAGFLSGAPPQPADAILVNAFKIPDFATNKGEINSILPRGNTYWSDSAMITRNSLLTQKQQNDTESTVSAKRTMLEAAAQVYDTRAQTDADEIKCLINGTKNNGIGGPECRDVLSKSLVDIVNAQVTLSTEANQEGPRQRELQRLGFQYFQPECPTLQKEYSEEISDPGTLQPLTDESKVYTQEFGVQLLAQLFKDSTHELGPAGSEKDPSFAETWRDRPPYGTKDNIYGPEDDPNITENGNKWGKMYDWGLKSVFAVVNETKVKGFPNSCCKDARKVKHYLVYPVGYDMQSVQTVLAGTFFTTDQLKTLATEAEKYDRIQVSGDQIAFEGGKKDKTYEDYNPNHPNWNPADDIGACARVCVEWDGPPTDPNRQCVRHEYTLPCTRSFGFEIVTEGETLHAGILGARLGFYTREIQKALNKKVSEARTYLDLCQTTEQFLRGTCGKDTIVIPTPTPDTCTSLSCGAVPPEPTDVPPTPIPPQPGCATSACFTMCANRNATGTVTVDFTWNNNPDCACNDIDDNELLINGVSQGAPSCINTISSGYTPRSCSFDNQPPNTVVCRKKGRYTCSGPEDGPICDACRTQSDPEMCVIAVQQ